MNSENFEATALTLNSNYWWLSVLKGLLFIILGIIAFYYPEGSMMTIGLFIGYFWLISGVMYFFGLFFNRKAFRGGWFLLEALLDIILGLLIVTSPVLSAELVPVFVGLGVIFLGATEISFAFSMSALGNKILFIVLGVISIASGLFMINHTVFAGIAIAAVLGFYFILYGVLKVIVAFKLKS